MALFGKTREEQLATIQAIPTENQVQSGELAFDSGARRKLENAFENQDFATFDRIIKAQERNWQGTLSLTQRRLAENKTAIANLTDFRGVSQAEQDEVLNSGQIAQRNARTEELSAQLGRFSEFLPGVNVSVAAPVRDARGNFIPASEAAAASPAATPVPPQQAPQQSAQQAGQTPLQEITVQNFQPTEFSQGNGLAELQMNVLNANPSANANDAFINGVFKAFHNRDATQQELDRYRGQQVNMVRTEVIGGAQAAGLPTVAPGTVNVPTGSTTPVQAKEQGLQRVLNPGQLSAFTEEQIVRDTQGGIWLNPNTTTQAQRDAVANNQTGQQISNTMPSPRVDATGDAQNLETGSMAPSAESFVEMFGDATSGGTNEGSQVVVDTAMSYVDTILARYDEQLSKLDAAITSAQGELDALGDRVGDLSTGTPNMDALNAERQNLADKQADLSEIKRQIALEQERLNLGLAQEANGLRPLSILGRRQETLQNQGLARIGALTSIAQVIQEDLNFAKDMANATISAMNADRKLQLDALDTLISLAQDKVIRLEDTEKEVIKSRQEAINQAIENSEKNADRLFELIKENPGAALSGGVTFNDSPQLALAKMAPFLALEAAAENAENRKTTTVDVYDQFGTKIGEKIIDINSGETVYSTVQSDSGYVSSIKDNTRVETNMGTGVATGIEAGSPAWTAGLDLQLDGVDGGSKKGAPVIVPIDGEIVSITNSCPVGGNTPFAKGSAGATCNGGFGNQVVVKDGNGLYWHFSHLDSVDVNPGSYLAGTKIGTQGNTGRTLGSTGVHVDVSVSRVENPSYANKGVNDDWLTSQEVASLLGVRVEGSTTSPGTGTAGLTRAAYTAATGKYLQANPDNTTADFDQLSVSEKLVWAQGGPQQTDDLEAYQAFEDYMVFYKNIGMDRDQALAQIQKDDPSPLGVEEQLIFDTYFPDKSGGLFGFFTRQ